MRGAQEAAGGLPWATVGQVPAVVAAGPSKGGTGAKPGGRRVDRESNRNLVRAALEKAFCPSIPAPITHLRLRYLLVSPSGFEPETL